jgi:hypothetical protein
MLHALHPYGLEHYAYIAVGVIALANAVFGFLYMYSLGIFNEGGGSYTASMRYLSPGLSLVVAVVLIQDYIFTIVVSSLSEVDQLSIRMPPEFHGTGISDWNGAGKRDLLPDHRGERVSAGGVYDAGHPCY